MLATLKEELPKKVHALRQLAQFSDTPQEILNHLDFMTEFESICGEAARLWRTQQKAKPEKFELNVKFMAAIGRVLKEERSTVSLTWLLGEAAVVSFVDSVRKLDKIAAPQAKAHMYSTAESLKLVIECMRKAMAGSCELTDDGAIANTDDFYSHFNITKLQKVRSDRQKAKKLVGELQEFYKAHDKVPVDNFDDMLSIMEKARLQTTAWGLISFLCNPEIQSDTAGGGALRQQLGQAWGLQTVDKGKPFYEALTQFLGKSNVTMVEELVSRGEGSAKQKQRATPVVPAPPPASSKRRKTT